VTKYLDLLFVGSIPTVTLFSRKATMTEPQPKTLCLLQLTDVRLIRVIRKLDKRYRFGMFSAYCSFMGFFWRDGYLEIRSENPNEIHQIFLDLIHRWLTSLFFDDEVIFESVTGLNAQQYMQSFLEMDQEPHLCRTWVNEMLEDNTQNE
jgi:hypothetical protein